MQFQCLPNVSREAADVLFLPVPLQDTVSFRTGTAQAPAAILEASEHLEYYDEILHWSPFKHLEVCVLDPVERTQDESLEGFHERLRATSAALPADKLVVALGGEHGISPSVIGPRLPEGGHVVVLDAHADFRDTYRGSPLNHACPARRLAEAGYGLTMIGLRSFFETEWHDLASHPRITVFPDAEIQREHGFDAVLEHLLRLEGPVWLSADMDGFDPALVPGVGTPQPGGLSWYQGSDIVATLMGNPNVKIHGMDVVELAPTDSPVSATVAAKLVFQFVSRWARRQGFDHRPATGGQTRVEYE